MFLSSVSLVFGLFNIFMTFSQMLCVQIIDYFSVIPIYTIYILILVCIHVMTPLDGSRDLHKSHPAGPELHFRRIPLTNSN